MLLGDEHVDRRDHEERKDRPDGHAAHPYQADGVACRSPGARYENQRKMARDRGPAGHQDAAQARQRGGMRRLALGTAAALNSGM